MTRIDCICVGRAKKGDCLGNCHCDQDLRQRGLDHIGTAALKDADGFAYVLEVGLGSFLIH